MLSIGLTPFNVLAENGTTARGVNEISMEAANIDPNVNTPTFTGQNEIPLIENDPTTPVSDNIENDVIWNNTENSYELTGDIEIKNGATLTIAPGSVVNGNGHSIKIYGVLDIDGATINAVNIIGCNTVYSPFDLDIKNSTITGGSLLNPTGNSGHGNINLSNNRFKDLSGYSYIWYPSSTVMIEKNVFESCGGLSIGTDYDVYIKNNVFHNCNSNGYVIESWATYHNSNVHVEYNSFYDDGIVLKLKYSSAKMVAINNYWHTTDEAGIAKRISDANTDYSLTEIINYLPMLTEPNVNTPTIPINNISLNQTNLLLNIGNTENLVVYYDPENTTDDKTASWKSSAPAIAIVDAHGKVTILSAGKTTITATVGSHTATCEINVPAILLGDVDANTKVQAYDALMALQIATSKITGTTEELKAADVDASGEVQAYDALRILQYATGKITAF